MNRQIRANVVSIDTFQSANLKEAGSAPKAQTEPGYSIDELHARYSSRLYKTILSITKSPEDAEDALQETFLRAWLAMHTFEGRSTVYSWLTRIAMNSAFELLRKRKNRAEISVDSQMDDNGEVFQLEIKDPSPNPEQLHDLSQRHETLQKSIQKLDDSLRKPLQMRVNNEASAKEIGKTLNISEGAVKVRLHRARVRLSSLQEIA